MATLYLRAVVLSLSLFLFHYPVLNAAIITVNTEDDVISAIDLQCSLREAIISANTDPFGVIIAPPGECAPGNGDDEIIFNPSVDGLPLLLLNEGAGENAAATGDLDITDNLTITGNGVDNTLIDGDLRDRVFDIFGPGTTVTMNDLTISQGILTDTPGAGIRNDGVLTLDTVKVITNFITGTAGQSIGGGVYNSPTGMLMLTDTTIDRNEADRGAGIFSENILVISSSSVINNLARAGGGLTNFGIATITNSTFSGNEVTGNGGAIDNSSAGAFNGVADILNSTIADNTAPDFGGGGIVNVSMLTLSNSIVANNPGGDCGPFTPITSDGNNLDSDGTCALTELTDISNTDPMIGSLNFNSGITLSHALLPGSPAIDAGSNLTCPPLDQRGVARPQDGLDDGIPVCDMGALEMLISELVVQVGNGAAGGGGCALAQHAQSTTSFPLYLLIPAFIFWRRLRRKNPDSGYN